jgi:hypothetical protein
MVSREQKEKDNQTSDPGRGRNVLLSGIALALMALASVGCDEGAVPKLRPVPDQIVEKLEDKIEISLSAKVDIIVVMDGSGSMATHQANVKKNIGAFVQELTKASYLDYRIAVTISGCSRSMAHTQYASGVCSEGIFHRASPSEQEPYYINRGDPGEELLLASRLDVGTANDAKESFFNPVIKAITPPVSLLPSNRGFLRNEAYLITIFVTDTDDQSDGVNPQQFFDNLRRIKGHNDLIIPYAAIIPVQNTGRSCTRDPVGSLNGSPYRIEEYLRIAGGSYFNVCSNDFGTDLVGVAQDLVSRVEPVIYLEDRPYVPSIKLYYGGVEIPNDFESGWVYDPQRNVIRLGKWLDLKGKQNLSFEINYTKANQF